MPRVRRFARLLFAAWLVAASCVAAAASPPEVDRGLDWLSRQVQPNGSIAGESSSTAATFQVRAETLTTLRQLAAAPTPLADLVAQDQTDAAETHARRAAALAPLGRDVSAQVAALLALQNADGGFGGARGYQGNALDTAFALLAFKAAGGTQTSAITRAIAFLQAAQAANGSFAVGDRSTIYVTGVALEALAAFAASQPVSTQISAARGWLVGVQTQGAYGNTFDNAAAVLALIGASTDTTPLGTAVGALKAAQLADGSWAGDPYLTALAIRALAAAAEVSPPPSTGQVAGTVVAHANGAALEGVQVQLSGPQSASATTTATGGFALAGLAPGSYNVSVSKAGYATVSLTASVAAGVTTSLGTIRLAAASTTAAVLGTVRDGATGQPLAGALVALSSGGSATTDANGAYQLTGITPGAATLTVSKTGYQTVTASATLSAGVVYTFSPSLYAPGQTPADATLKGKIVNRVSGQPVASATVKVGTATITTAASGEFTFNGLAPGAITIEVSASGYITATFGATLSAGLNDVGTILVDPAPTAITVGGKVTDAGTNLPIGGAVVTIASLSLTATTNSNGIYAISGVTQTSFTLAVSAPGYRSASIAVTLPTLADATVDAALDRAPAGAVTLRRVSTNLPAYEPFRSIEIEAEVQNNAAAPAGLFFGATIKDPAGQAVLEVNGIAATIAPGPPQEIELEAHSGNLAPGTYSVVVRALDLDGNLQLEGSASFQINAVARVSGGVNLDPPIVQSGSGQPVRLTANLANHGNLTVPAGLAELTITLVNPEPGAGAAATADLLPKVLGDGLLARPVGASLDAQGNFYTFNTTDRRVIRIAPDGATNVVATLPASFSSPPVNVFPVDAVADAAGNVHILNFTSEIFTVAPGGAITRKATGLFQQTAFDRDAAGNFYIVDGNANQVNRVVKVPASGPTTTYPTSGLSNPRGIVRAPDGNLYVTNRSDRSISKIAPDGAITPFLTSGLSAPLGITADGSGNLYVADNGAGTVVKVTSSAQVSPYATGVTGATDVRFDSLGNLYVTANGQIALYRVPANGGAGQIHARTLVINPQGMQYDASGNLFAAGSQHLNKKDAADVVTTVSAGLSGGKGVAIGSAGEVYVASSFAGTILKFVGTAQSTVGSGLSTPYGVALDGGTTLYATESGGAANRVVSFNAAVANGPKTVVAESLLTTPRAVRATPAGERFVLNSDSLTRIPTSGAGGFVVPANSFGFVASGLALAPDGSFYVQETNAVRRVTAGGAVSALKTGLPNLASGIALDASGNALVAVSSGNATFPTRSVLRIDAAGNTTILATLSDTPTSLVSDGAGGIYATLAGGHIARVTSAGAVSLATTTAIAPAATRLALDAAGGKLYFLNGGAGIRAFDLATRVVSTLAGPTQTFNAIEFATGQLLATISATRELMAISTTGQVTPVAAGFSTPGPIAWDGTRLIFSDANSTFTLTPGGLATIVAYEKFGHLQVRGGAVYGTRGDGNVYTFRPGIDAVSTIHVSPGGTLQGLAFRADGLLTVASDRDGSAWSFDASRQLVASYAGIDNPTSLAVDSGDNVYVAVASALGAKVARIAPGGKQSSVFSPVGANGLAFDGAGQLHGTNASAVIRYAANGTTTQVASVLSATLFGIAFDAGAILVADDTNSIVRKAAGAELPPFAVGLSSPKGVRVDSAGNLLITSSGNGTLARLANGQLSIRGTGLALPTSVTLAANGDILVGGGSGHLYAIDTAGRATEVTNVASIYGGGASTFALNSMATNSAGTIYSVSTFRNQVDRIAYHPAGSGPQAGTTFPALRAAFGEIAVGGASPLIDFGTWTPPYAGDFQLTLKPVATQVGGEATNLLHVGPHATAQMAAAQSLVLPGNPTVDLTIQVDGADFTTLARPDLRSITIAVPEIAFLSAMTADASGAIYTASAIDRFVRRYTPTGGLTAFLNNPYFSAPAGIITMRGAIPIDNAQNLYVAAGTNGQDIYRIVPAPGGATGTGTLIATIPEVVRSMVRASDDTLYALGTSGIFHVEPNPPNTLWKVTRLELGVLSASGVYLTIDAKDNLYVLNSSGGGISTYRTDGTRASLVRPDASGQPSFEFEGGSAIAGDCADNLFITPYDWSQYGQNGEEHTLVQLIGRTGRTAQLFDGTKTVPALIDMDGIAFDRFSSSLLFWADSFRGVIHRMPVTCGAIDTDLHVVVPAAQPAMGFSVAPKALVTRADGQREYIWGFKDVTASGKSVGLRTTLQNVQLGETRAVVSEAFLTFRNAFASGDLKIPVPVPAVHADSSVDIGISTDKVQYGANGEVAAAIHLANRDVSGTRAGTLVVELTDPQGARIALVSQQAVTVPVNGALDVAVTFNTGTYLTGTYAMKATLVAASGGAELAKASVGFYIVAGDVTLVPSLATDKPVYDANDNVAITARVRNVTLNAIASGYSVQVKVRNPAGAEILARESAIPSLVPQALKDSVFQLELRGAPAGGYVAEMVLKQAGIALGDPLTARFTVLSTADTGTGLAGAVSVTRFANKGDPVSITATLRNQGNAALADLPLAIKVIDPSTGQVVQQWTAAVTLGQGAQQQVSQSWSTAGASAGTYVASAGVTIAGREIPLGQGNITIGVVQPFSFAPVSNAPLDTVVESNLVSIAGIVAPAAISIAEGEYRIGTGGWTGAPGTVNPGDVVRVRVTSARTFNATSTAALTVAGFTAGFSVTTVNPDTTPDPFTFFAQNNVPLASVRTSNTVFITGIDVAVPVSIVGGEYSLNGGPFTATAGTLVSGASVAVRLTSAAALGTTTSARLTVSNVSGTFSVTTTAEDRTPDPIAFAAQNAVPTGSVRTSNTVTITGINVAVPISIAGGEYNLNGGAFTAAAGTVAAGNTVTVRQTASTEFSKTTTAMLTVSDVTANFAVTTEGEDRVPDTFAFAQQNEVVLATAIVSNNATITGINTAVPISVAGGEYRVNGGAFTTAASTVRANDTVSVRQISASTFATATTATLTVGDVAVPFTVKTRTAALVGTSPSFSADARVLVLLSCKLGGNDDADDDGPCLEQRRTFLDGYLAQKAIAHRIVTDADAFKVELRGGAYNTYWISGGGKKLKDLLAEELREAAFRGETLVVDGVHDNRNHDIDEVLGVRFKGKPSSLSTVTLTGSFLPAGTFTVSGTKPIRVELTTGLRQARFNTGDPAIATSEYGYGKGLLFAFDLTGTLLAQSASSLLGDMLVGSFDQVAPFVPAIFTGGAYVPIATTLHNTEPVAIDLGVTATLPAGFSLAAGAPPATLAGAEVKWTVHLAAGGSQTLEWAVRTPEASAIYTIPLALKQFYGTSVVAAGSSGIVVRVRGLDVELARVIAEVEGLAPTSSAERSARDNAALRLRAAQGHITAARWEDAIASLIAANDYLEDVTSIDVKPQLAAAGLILKEVERKWWAGLPACPATPLCRP